MPMIDVHGVRIHYVQEGQGTDILLLHGLTANLAVWMFNRSLATLSGRYRVTAYDMRGHGASEVVPTGYTSAHMARELCNLHELLGLKRAYIVGHSFGAVVAVHAAVLSPERVAGLVLSDPYFPGLPGVEPNYRRSALWSKVVSAFEQVGVTLVDEIDFAALFRVVATMSHEHLKTMRATMGPGYARWLEQLAVLANTTCGRDAFEIAGLTRDLICSLSVPVVALYDEHTEFQATREYLAQNLRRCVVEIVPGARHLAPIEAGPAFNELVLKHIDRLESQNTTVA